MSVPQVDPQTVAERLDQDEDAVYLDVRTVREFRRGHPRGALNVPLYEPDPDTGRPRINPRFLEVVQEVLEPAHTVFVGCASGQRSQEAALALRRLGFDDVANVATGFSGKTDPLGNVIARGWKQLDLPLERGEGGDRSYDSLRRRADQQGSTADSELESEAS